MCVFSSLGTSPLLSRLGSEPAPRRARRRGGLRGHHVHHPRRRRDHRGLPRQRHPALLHHRRVRERLRPRVLDNKTKQALRNKKRRVTRSLVRSHTPRHISALPKLVTVSSRLITSRGGTGGRSGEDVYRVHYGQTVRGVTEVSTHIPLLPRTTPPSPPEAWRTPPHPTRRRRSCGAPTSPSAARARGAASAAPAWRRRRRVARCKLQLNAAGFSLHSFQGLGHARRFRALCFNCVHVVQPHRRRGTGRAP